MPKKRKKSKPQPIGKQNNSSKNNTALRKNYLKILEKVCFQTGCSNAFKMLTKEEKILIFASRIYIDALKIEKGQHIPEEVQKFFKGCIKDFYTVPALCIQPNEQLNLTNFELLVGMHFIEMLSRMDAERQELLLKEFAPMQKHIGLLEKTISFFVQCYIFLVNSTNLFEQTVYCLKLNFSIKDYPTPGMHYESTLQAIPPRSSDYIENGKKRRVFQLGYVNNNLEMKWVFVPVKKLKGIYKGDKKYLPICIQIHAYHRLFERMEAIHEINSLWHFSNTLKNSLQIEIYNGHILIPYFYWDHKCGYFVAAINKNRLIIKTFLFLTHQNTPEGEKLQEILGLSKEEIAYWKIDTLHNFINSGLEKDHQMMEAFQQAGISHLFNIDPLSEIKVEQKGYNWDSLTNYINRGKLEMLEEDIDEKLEEQMADAILE